MDIMLIFSTAASGVLPVVLTTFLGWFLRQKGILSGEFAAQGNKLVFRLFLPIMLFVNVYEIQNLGEISWSFVLYCMVMGVVLFLLGALTAVLTTRDPGRRGVLTQAAFRSNMAIIGLSLAETLGSDGALAAASVLSAFAVTQFNIQAVLSFAVFSQGDARGSQRLKAIPGQVLRNPMLIGIVLGLGALLLRSAQTLAFGMPVFTIREQLPFFYKVLTSLKGVTTPFALVMLGGQFAFSAVKSYRKEIVLGTALRILVAPVLGIGLGILLTRLGVLSLGPSEYPAMVALFGSPAAVSSAVMASEMGGDGQLATQITVWTSLCSILTVFATSCVLMGMGLM